MAARAVSPKGEVYQCKSCEGTLDANAFYVSNLSRCKECVKRAARENRQAKLDYYRNYDRKRYRDHGHRKEAARNSARSEAGIESKKRHAERIKDTPVRKARIAVGNAVRDGRLEKADSCFFCGCGGALQAHHCDYSRPLDVFWLCPACHGKLHTLNGDFLKEPAQ